MQTQARTGTGTVAAGSPRRGAARAIHGPDAVIDLPSPWWSADAHAPLVRSSARCAGGVCEYTEWLSVGTIRRFVHAGFRAGRCMPSSLAVQGKTMIEAKNSQAGAQPEGSGQKSGGQKSGGQRHRPAMVGFLGVAAALLGMSLAAPVAAADAAQGDAQRARDKVAMCVGCHGIKGYRASFPEVYTVPMIAGQSERYIAAALEGYRKGDRSHPTMRAIAGSLTDTDILDLAAYYAKGGLTALGSAK